MIENYKADELSSKPLMETVKIVSSYSDIYFDIARDRPQYGWGSLFSRGI